MHDFVIRNALSIDGAVQDIAIQSGKIVDLGRCEQQGQKEVDLKGQHYVSAGWMDLHTHCFASSPIYHDEPDCIGVRSGVTTVVDAGSAGADDIDEFALLAKEAQSNVYAFLNISKIGLLRQNELANMADIDQALIEQSLLAHSDFIVGFKVRMSKSVVGENGLEPLLRAKAIQKKYHLPLMIHIGNAPPNLDDIADVLEEGDIITHCFNGKPNCIFDTQGQIRASVIRALERGVIFDIGHGRESFSFNVAERARHLTIYPRTISSDIYSNNRLNGPVYSLAHVMTKFLCLGYSKERIINSVTGNVANVLKLKRKGQLEKGFDADLTLFTIKKEAIWLTDSEGETRESQEQLVPLGSVINGQLFVTEEGKNYGIR